MERVTSYSSIKQPQAPQKQLGTRVVDSATLLGSHQEIQILHTGEVYRLRKTRQGKLILTK